VYLYRFTQKRVHGAVKTLGARIAWRPIWCRMLFVYAQNSAHFPPQFICVLASVVREQKVWRAKLQNDIFHQALSDCGRFLVPDGPGNDIFGERA